MNFYHTDGGEGLSNGGGDGGLRRGRVTMVTMNPGYVDLFLALV
ncbi:hypothetical protein SBA4_4580032 [Candidatus Sulfopaludibacter sp. SbA4]|nr:hypothetical protein SBA4_4580032 [Candidatus Sulfopaludibacter sp. SbA4]